MERIEELLGGWPEDQINDGFEEALLLWRGHTPDGAHNPRHFLHIDGLEILTLQS